MHALRLALLLLATLASCSKLSAPRVWVKRPGSKKVEYADSLASLCAEHELDEEAMLAVSRGEADDYEGWECGEAGCDEADDEAAEEAVAEAEEAAESESEAVVAAAKDGDEESEEEAEADAAPAAATPPAPALSSKMIVGLLAPMGATQLMKRFDEKSASFLLGLRACFTACVGVHTAVDFLVKMKVEAANETALVKAAPNPLSMLMGGGLGATQQTARVYDLQQLSSIRTSFRMGAVVVLLLHWKFKWNQVLVYHVVQALVELFYHPLVQIHLLGKDAEGALSRPFGAAQGQPDMSALFKGMAPTPAPAS